MKNNDVKGNRNNTAGRDVKITNNYHAEHHSSGVDAIFKAADEMFKNRVIENGCINRGGNEISYCSKSLFSSLMQLGIPYDTAINIPFQIIPLLADILDISEKETISTSDIRVAVVECIGGLVYENHTEEQVSMWSAAYIRRYGNPEKSSLKVHDNGQEIDLSYSYVKKVVIPHLYKRIFNIEGVLNPIQEYSEVFSAMHLDGMAKEIVRFSNTLNLYCIRYKTLINLLEDLIVEPPHPWMVNEKTMTNVASYNLERAAHHLNQVKKTYKQNNPAYFNQSIKECLMHLSASILARYGAFLGVGSKYGFVELRRALLLKVNNSALWKFCKLHEMESDLKAIGCSVDLLLSRLNRIMHQLHIPDTSAKYSALHKEASELAEIALSLTKDIGGDANKLLQRTLVPRAAE